MVGISLLTQKAKWSHKEYWTNAGRSASSAHPFPHRQIGRQKPFQDPLEHPGKLIRRPARRTVLALKTVIESLQALTRTGRPLAVTVVGK
jgi:hypothetical protein